MTLEAFRHQFSKVLKDIPKISLIGIRGYNLNSRSENTMGIYDDCIIRCLSNEIKIFTASVDPGRYYINHPVNPLGCAKLKCGLWSYKLGEHHTHDALVQADEVFVERLDKTGKRVSEENGYFGINIHSGGPEYLVGRYSAGCQVIKADEAWNFQWLDFFEPIKDGLKIFNQNRIPYLLLDKLDARPA